MLVDIGKAYVSGRWNEFKQSVVNAWNNPNEVIEDAAHDIYSFGKGFAKTPVNIFREGKELGEKILKYSSKPLGLKALEVIRSLEKLGTFNKEYDFDEKLKIIGAMGWKMAQGMQMELEESTSTAEGRGQVLGEITIGLGVPRVLKSFKIIGKVIDEATDFSKRDFDGGVLKEKVCPRDTSINSNFEDWGNTKQQTLRSDIPKSELQSGVGYSKLKNELLEESHIGHGNFKLLAENGLSVKDVEKFGGQIINDLINDKSLKQTFNNWGISKDGTNQFLEHTIGKKYDRIAKIAKGVGINPTDLTDVFSDDVVKVTQAMKKFDKISDEMIKKSTIKNLNLQGGRQEAYYYSCPTNPEEGIIVLKYDAKKATVMFGDKKYFNDNFKTEKP